MANFSRNRYRLMVTWLFVFVIGFGLQTGHASAHASLVQANPEPDSRLERSPDKVELVFNERLENELFRIQVLDSNGKRVSRNPTVLSKDQRQISQALPELSEGVYTISYSVISADGHPVGGSYVVTVGNAVKPPPKGVSSSHEQGGTDQDIVQQWMAYVIRAVYYLAFLILIGWVLWRTIAAPYSEEQQKISSNWLLQFQRMFLPALIFMGLVQFSDLSSAWDLSTLDSFLRTNAGLSWMTQFVLAALGFGIVGRNRLLDWIWVAALIVAKSFSGHAMAPPYFMLLLHEIHLLAAALWAGGLVYVLVHWRKFPEYTMRFLPMFSKYALLSLIVLTLTGVLAAFAHVPKISYVLYTLWGRLLIAKTALVLLVFMCGAFIRIAMAKRNEGMLKSWLAVDIGTMAAIICIVGTLTYSNPAPKNEPLHWHVMGETVHMSVDVAPNEPGTNQFDMVIWLPKQTGKPKSVQLLLRSLDKDIAPIEVPIAAVPAEPVPYDFPGFERYQYSAKGPYLPFAGKWELEARIMDAQDNETVNRMTERIY